jgi:cyclopropane-fatty-acyl-phospholipid synthase
MINYHTQVSGRGKAMKWKIAKSVVLELLQSAGITVNGHNPWDIQVHNDEFYTRVLHQGSLGAGEAYMDGWWDCPALDQFCERVIRANLENKIRSSHRLAFKFVLSKILNFQTRKRSLEVGEKHYDLGNDLFKYMLDSRMIYTCGYWHNANSLDEAQLNKLNLTCQKLWLKPGMRVLDIGCGWGGFAKYAAENFGVEVVGITISKNQYDAAKENCKDLPIEIRFQDYRDLNEKFDRIVSLGMFEHVGHLNYRTYMQTVQNCLTDDGIFLLHTIGNNETFFETNPWISKYIFPNGMLPSIAQIGKAAEKLFVMEDWHNFGADYDKTLMAWHANFHQHWDELKAHYSEHFRRMWNFYLLSTAAAFRTRDIQLWQIVFSKKGLKGGYQVTRPYFQVEKESRDSSKNQYSVPR